MHANVVYHPGTVESRGFGFVLMGTPNEAETAIAAVDGTRMYGKCISVQLSRRAHKQARPSSTRFPPRPQGGYFSFRSVRFSCAAWLTSHDACCMGA